MVQSYLSGAANVHPHLKLMLPWARQSPHPKRHLDWFSHFLYSSLYNGPPLSPSNLPLRQGDGPTSNTWFLWAHLSPQCKQHLDQLSHFCMAHDHDRQTDRQTYRQTEWQTDHATPSITIGRSYIVLRSGLIIMIIITVVCSEGEISSNITAVLFSSLTKTSASSTWPVKIVY